MATIWNRSKWTKDHLDRQKVEFLLRTDRGIEHGVGEFQVRQSPHGLLSIEIVVDAQRRDSTERVQTRYYPTGEEVGRIERHPDQSVATFRLLGTPPYTELLRQAEKWHKIRLRADAVAEGAMKKVLDAFEDAMPPGHESKGCALFARDELDATVIFVSPRLARAAPHLLERFSAVECEPPAPRKTGEHFGTALLLATHVNHAWSLLNPAQ